MFISLQSKTKTIIQMETFTNTFDISFNPTGQPNKERARLTVVLENVSSVHDAKELLWKEQGIHVTSISRLT